MPQFDSSTAPIRQRYDALTLFFHWVTAAAVIFMFASAHVWAWLERGTLLRKELQSLHISCGILLAAVMILRLLWRIGSQWNPRYKMPKTETSRAMSIIAHATHGLLYLLLITQVVLGFLFRWAQEEPFRFFGLFDIPTLAPVDITMRHTFATLHNGVAWALIGLASVHALAALFHHYVLRDNVLRRMLPRV